VQATLIVNPYASNVSEERVRRIEELLQPTKTLLTEGRGHAVELARAAAGDAIYVFGGDGVTNEVLNGLERDVPVGVLPGGHTNVFARALGLPRDPLEAAGVIGRSKRRISLGRVNGRRFAFAAGIGVDSEAVRELETVTRRRAGRRPGDLAYARFVAARLLGGCEPVLDVVGHGRAALAFVSNDAVFTYAGSLPLRFSPDARFELGLDLAAPRCIHLSDLARLLPRLVAGRGLNGGHGVHRLHDADRIELRCDRPLPLQADGEDLGDVEAAVFEAERSAVTVLTG
jgi:diacylglycerol kinase family enzyme